LKTKICLAGATGKVGRNLVRAILDAEDLELRAAIGKENVGKNLGVVLAEDRTGITISGSIDDVLKADIDVFIDYTRPEVVKSNVRTAIKNRLHVVIGTSGLSDEDYNEINEWARENSVGVIAAGNFSMTATLMQHFATAAAKFLPHWEILDYAADTKRDAPSGTARELSFELKKVAKPCWAVPIESTLGLKESRGVTLNGSQIHSIRIPGFYSSVEIVFGLAGERLSLKHDSISYQPYVAGTLLAVRKVSSLIGLRRGLESIFEFSEDDSEGDE
jgi:4-hydroxy-tetrahydrodipicolinate reductase